MIVITAHGRLAATPTLKTLANGAVCEFRLLSTRFAKNQEHTEAVNFFCYGEEAERFAESVEKGQLISATGTQETSNYTDKDGHAKSFVKYRLTWYERGARPMSSRQNAPASGAYDRPPQNARPYPNARPEQPAHRRPDLPMQQPQREAPPHGPFPQEAPPPMVDDGHFDDVSDFF